MITGDASKKSCISDVGIGFGNRPEGPRCNSRDRQVGDLVFNECEVRRTEMIMPALRASIVFVGLVPPT
jgi:hypothetical protein